MPKILEDTQNNLIVYIYTNDHQPAHVHVLKGRKSEQNRLEMKIYIGSQTEPPKLIEADSKLKNKDIVKALQLVAEYQQFLLKKWEEIHGK